MEAHCSQLSNDSVDLPTHQSQTSDHESATFLQLIEDMSSDSWFHCLSYLNPYDFILIHRICKKFNSLTNSNDHRINKYWQKQCVSICTDVIDIIAIDHQTKNNAPTTVIANNFRSDDWKTIYYQIMQIAVYGNLYRDQVSEIHSTPSYYDNRLIHPAKGWFRCIYQINGKFKSKFPITLMKYKNYIVKSYSQVEIDINDNNWKNYFTTKIDAMSIGALEWVFYKDYCLLFSMILHTKIFNNDVNICPQNSFRLSI